jgi:hypothetical protein
MKIRGWRLIAILILILIGVCDVLYMIVSAMLPGLTAHTDAILAQWYYVAREPLFFIGCLFGIIAFAMMD